MKLQLSRDGSGTDVSGVVPGTSSGAMGVPDGKVCVAVMGITDWGRGVAFCFGAETGTNGTEVSFGAAATGTDALGFTRPFGVAWLTVV